MNLSIYLAHANNNLSPIARTGCIPGGHKMLEIVIFPYLLTLAEAEHSSAWYMEEKIC